LFACVEKTVASITRELLSEDAEWLELCPIEAVEAPGSMEILEFQILGQLT
jgi:hypothetical protein